MSDDAPSSVMKHISAIAVPGMYLYYKYNEFKRQRLEDMKRKVTERELDHLNQKIVSAFYSKLFIIYFSRVRKILHSLPITFGLLKNFLILFTRNFFLFTCNLESSCIT